jgi:hypothetical protein
MEGIDLGLFLLRWNGLLIALGIAAVHCLPRLNPNAAFRMLRSSIIFSCR